MAVAARSRSMRSFLAAVLTFTLLLTPALTHFGAASAAQPHQANLMHQTGHCQMQHSSTSDHQKSAGKCCCMSTFFAVTLETAAPLADSSIQRPPLVFAHTSFHVPFQGEIATPPPRLL